MYHSKILHFSPFSTYTRIVKVQKIDKIKDWQRYGRTGTFIAGLFIIGEKEKQSKCPLRNKNINNLVHVYNVILLHDTNNPDTHNTKSPKYFVEGKNPDTKEYIVHYFTDMNFNDRQD